jgi:hypothetical protein
MSKNEIFIALWLLLVGLWVLPVYLAKNDFFDEKIYADKSLAQYFYLSTLFIAACSLLFIYGIYGLFGIAFSVGPALLILHSTTSSGEHRFTKKNGAADKRYKNNHFSFSNTSEKRMRAETVIALFWTPLVWGGVIGLVCGWFWFKSFTR